MEAAGPERETRYEANMLDAREGKKLEPRKSTNTIGF